MIGDNINDIRSMLSSIFKKLNAIQEENDENIQELVNYSTSTELCIGTMLCRYGKLYKIVLDSESFDEILQKVEELFNKEKFETYEEEIEKIQEIAFNYIKANYSFECGKQQLLTKIKEEYIMKTIIDCL